LPRTEVREGRELMRQALAELGAVLPSEDAGPEDLVNYWPCGWPPAVLTRLTASTGSCARPMLWVGRIGSTDYRASLPNGMTGRRDVYRSKLRCCPRCWRCWPAANQTSRHSGSIAEPGLGAMAGSHCDELV
jgi:hypothetical protein